MTQAGYSIKPVVICFLHELDEMRERGMTLDEIIGQVSDDFSRVQVIEWTSPIGNHYRFLIQQLDTDGVPLFEVRNKLITKEFTG